MGFFLTDWIGNVFKKEKKQKEDKPKIKLKKCNNPIDISQEAKEIKKREKIYLVLPGGGACGRWQIGALAWLKDIGLFNSITGIAGTSVGGLNALLTAKYFNNFNEAINTWNQITENKDIYEGIIEGGIGGFLGILGQTFKDNNGKSILNPKGLYELCDNEFKGLTLKDFEDLDVITTATDISIMEDDIYTKDNCNLGCEDLAKRTSSIPLAFPAIIGKNRGHSHVDGGFGNNNPVMTAIKRGATKIIIVGTYPIKTHNPKIENNIISIGKRMPQVAMDLFEQKMWQEVEIYQELANLSEEYDTIEFLKLYPAENTGSALEFGNIEQMQKGYNLAKKYVTKEKIKEFFGDENL